MSIINDAIKKARKEFEWKHRTIPRDIVKEEKVSTVSPKSSEIKWVVIVVVSLVLIVSLLGSIFLYKRMSRLNTTYSSGGMLRAKSEIPTSIQHPRQNIIPSPGTKLEDVIELNGIVYGPEGKWAIINNKIVKEGDSLLNGRLAFIAKDFVRIETGDGEDIVLELR